MLQLLNKKNKLGNKGFSLVELIIVIAIMAVLVAILLPQYLQYVQKSKISADDSTATTIMNAVKVAASDTSVSLTPSATYTVTWATAGGLTLNTANANLETVLNASLSTTVGNGTAAANTSAPPAMKASIHKTAYVVTIVVDATGVPTTISDNMVNWDKGL